MGGVNREFPITVTLQSTSMDISRRKLAIEMLDSEIVNREENGQRFEDQGKKPFTHVNSIVNSCQGKDAGVLFCYML